tara:strand:- start:1244 stop:1477 length:234 start_codon:yes stop_codon:yes gene_type:complete
VIIDDGGHTAQMISLAAELLFPDGACLNNATGTAVYVVEDLHVMTRWCAARDRPPAAHALTRLADQLPRSAIDLAPS